MAVNFNGADLVVTFKEVSTNGAELLYQLEYQCANGVVNHYVDANRPQSTASDGMRVYQDTLTHTENANAGLTRSPRVRMRTQNAKGKWSQWVVIDAQNPVPVLPEAPVVTRTFDGVSVSVKQPADSDLEGYIAWVSTTPDFPLDAAHERYRGKSTSFSIPLPDNDAYFLRVAPYDAFGFDPFSAWEAVKAERNPLDIDGIIDIDPPAIPTGLAVSSKLTDAGVTLTATWNAPADADLSGYNLAIAENDGNFIDFTVGSPRFERTALPRGTKFSLKVSAFDKLGNPSGYSAVAEHVTKKDDVPPAIPTGINVEAAFIRWINAADTDLAFVKVYESTTNVRASATKVAEVAARPGGTSTYTRSNVTPGTYYYWLRSVDTSGNDSADTAVATVTTAGLTNLDLAPGQEFTGTGPTLPSLVGYTGSNSFLNTTDGKLYRLVNGAWTAAVPSTDISGQLTDAQIATVSATKLAGKITSTQIGDKEIKTPNLAAGSVTGDIIAGNTVKATNLIVANTDSIIPDSAMQDKDFWFTSGAPGTATLVPTNASWPMAPVNIASITPPSNAVSDWYTPYFPMEYGATYRIRFSYYADPNFVGWFNPMIHMPGEMWFSPISGNADGHVADSASSVKAPTVGVVTHEFTRTNAGHDGVKNWQFRFYGAFTGNFQFFVSIVRVADGTLIKDGVIETKHVKAKSITTDLLDVGAVKAGNIGAGEVTTTKLAIVDIQRMNRDPGFNDLAYWDNNGVYNNSLSVGAYSAGGWYKDSPRDPSAVAQMGTEGFVTLWDGSATPPGTGRQHLFSKGSTGVQGGALYELSATCINYSSQGIVVYARFWDAYGTYLGDFSLDFPATAFGSPRQYKTMQGMAPNAAASVQFILFNLSGSAFTGYARLGGIQLTKASGATLIEPGAITTEKITVNSLDGDRIRIDTLDANKIKANTVLSQSVVVSGSNQSLGEVVKSGNALSLMPVNSGDQYQLVGSTLQRNTTGYDDWSTATYSRERYTNGAFVKGSFTGNRATFGMLLSTQTFPNASDKNMNIDYRWHIGQDSNIYIGFGGSWVALALVGGSYRGALLDLKTSYSIRYDGDFVYWFADSTLVYQLRATANLTMCFGATIAAPASVAKVTNIQFTPYAGSAATSSNSWQTTALVEVTGNNLRAVPSSANYDAQYTATTLESFRGAAVMSGRMTTAGTFLGLAGNNAVANPNYTQIHYWMWHRSENGSWYVGHTGWQWNQSLGTSYNGVTFTNDTVFTMEYDGSTIRWLADGVLMWSLGATPNLTVFGKVTFSQGGCSVAGVRITQGNDNSLVNTDPAARINQASTKINPGQILIQGSTSLDAWRDQTEIRGGAIKANSIGAEKLNIASRNVAYIGLIFEWNPANGWVYWSEGYIYWTDDWGNAVQEYIPAGNTGGTPPHLWFYWFPGAGRIHFNQENPGRPGIVHIASWWGGANLNVTYGGTNIHGDRISTGTITASRMNVQQLSAISANLGAVTAGSININNRFIVDSAGTVTMQSATSGARHVQTSNGQWLYDANNVLRVEISV
jgi:hypothetical protein